MCCGDKKCGWVVCALYGESETGLKRTDWRRLYYLTEGVDASMIRSREYNDGEVSHILREIQYE